MEWRFSFAGIPVRVSPFFLLTMVVLHPRGRGDVYVLLPLWVVVGFVGVLAHELGHALAARAFGQRPAILLHAMGGLTTWTPRGAFSPWRRIFVSVAGPGVGLALGTGALVVARVAGLSSSSGTAGQALNYFVWVNLGWGILNLLPMLPLDGGNVMASLFEGVAGRGGRQAAHVISIAMAVGLGLLALMSRAPITAVLSIFFVWANVQALRAPRPGPPLPPPPAPPAA